MLVHYFENISIIQSTGVGSIPLPSVTISNLFLSFFFSFRDNQNLVDEINPDVDAGSGGDSSHCENLNMFKL